MFKIGDFSKFAKVSVRMLRYYEKNGLISPEKVDDFTGYRYYSAKQIKRLNQIVILRDLGFNVAEIALYLTIESPLKHKEMLQDKINVTKVTIKNEKIRLRMLEKATVAIDKKEQDNMEYNVEIKSLPSFKAVSYKKTESSYEDEGKLWGEMAQKMGMNNIATTGVFYAEFLDGMAKQGDVEVEIAMSVDKLGDDVDGLVFKETEHIDKAVCVLVPGDYSNINPAFEYLANYIEENNLEINGNPRQVPIKSPYDEKNPENYLTELQMPVK